MIRDGDFEYAENATGYTVRPAEDAVYADLVIPDEYNGKPVTEIADSAFCDREDIGSVTMGANVVKIGGCAFTGCGKLKSVVICGSVREIEEEAFGECRALTDITIEDGVKIIGEGAFSGCESLKKIAIPGSVVFIDSDALHDCRALEDVTIGDGVTSIGENVFARCSSLRRIVIPDTVKYVFPGAFDGCVSLTCATVGVCTEFPEETLLGRIFHVAGSRAAFEGCVKLIEVCNRSSLDISAGAKGHGLVGLNARNVYAEGAGKSFLRVTDDGFEMYDDGKELILTGYRGDRIDIVLPETEDGRTYEIYAYAFYGCTTLKSVIVPDCVTKIGVRAFYGCEKLSGLTVGSKVTEIGEEAFDRCSALRKVSNASKVEVVSGRKKLG
ncbi:MAG: leucine-rich repeat domain-containing protein [Bacteroidales bacterium]|nr:leucine-rich repeat domain-containing protein [Bacteroidales bacterium]